LLHVNSLLSMLRYLIHIYSERNYLTEEDAKHDSVYDRSI
jgi:hypothetical protein